MACWNETGTPASTEELASWVTTPHEGAAVLTELYQIPLDTPLWKSSQRAQTSFQGKRRSIQIQGLKYVWNSTGGEELYDLDRDPGERVNLAQQRPDETRRLREALLRWSESLPTQDASPAPELSEEAKSRLRAMGYLR